MRDNSVRADSSRALAQTTLGTGEGERDGVVLLYSISVYNIIIILCV